MTLRSFSHHFPTEREETGRGFTVNRVLDDPNGSFMDPYLMVDAYTLSEPFFAPHPHAGFAPLTYVFPESEIGLINRDSRGTHNRIGPGAMHWMTSGKGIVHEEVPELKGRPARGLQIFVNLAAANKFMEPGYVFAEAHEIPVLEKDGATIRAVLGESNGIASPAKVPTPVRLIDVTLPPGASFEQQVRRAENAFVYIFEGDAIAEGQQGRIPLSTFDVYATARDGELLRLHGGNRTARFVLYAGEPLNEPVVSYGPFVMASRTDLMKVMDDYRMGRMGKVEPSTWGADGRPRPLLGG